MTFFSLDPCFDFTIYAIQVCFHIHPYLSSTQAFRSRQKQGKVINGEDPKNTIYKKWFESTTNGEGKLCFVFKILKMFLQLTWLKEKGDLFQVVPFFNRLKFHGRYFESYSACMTGNSFMLMPCPKVMSWVIHPFIEDE